MSESSKEAPDINEIKIITNVDERPSSPIIEHLNRRKSEGELSFGGGDFREDLHSDCNDKRLDLSKDEDSRHPSFVEADRPVSLVSVTDIQETQF